MFEAVMSIPAAISRRVEGALLGRTSRLSVVIIATLCVFGAPAEAQDASSRPTEQTNEPDTRYGRGEFIRPRSEGAADANRPLPGGGFSATYRDADVSFVVNQVLGEFLGVDYTIANDVRGEITLRMEDVRTRGEALQRLRNSLAAIGVSLVDGGDFIAVVSGAGAVTGGSVAILEPGQPAPPGTGVAVLTLRHAEPSAIAALVGALAPGARVAHSDDVRRAMVLTGDANVLTAASEAVALLDVDWFEQISTGVFVLQHVAASDLSGELRPLLGPYASSVEIIPIERLNLLVVMASSSGGLRHVRGWVERLDRARTGSRVAGQLAYTVRHADPVDLLASLNQLLGIGHNSQGYDTASFGGEYASDQSMRQRGAAGPRPPTPDRDRRSADSELQIGAAPNQNLILVRGSEEQVAEVADLLRMLDQPRPQVLIEAAIVEVTLTEDLRYGVNWSGLVNEHVGVTLSDHASGAPSARFPGLSASYLNVGLEAVLNLLSSQTEVEVISRPSVLALHNEQAELQVGDQVPVTLQSAVSVENPNAPIVNQTAYRNTGVILTVTPQIRAGGVVEVRIVQEVSGVAQTTSSGIDSPTITQRRISSTLLVPSGQSVALGGLISTRRTTGQTGVPALRRVPVVGRLFRSESISEDRTELLVILTPRIISDPNELGDAMLSLPSAIARLEARMLEQ